jgi:hypothetical protein
MKTFKQIVHALSKIVAGIAVAALLFAPFTNGGLAVMAVAFLTALACLPVYTWSEPDDEAENPN